MLTRWVPIKALANAHPISTSFCMILATTTIKEPTVPRMKRLICAITGAMHTPMPLRVMIACWWLANRAMLHTVLTVQQMSAARSKLSWLTILIQPWHVRLTWISLTRHVNLRHGTAFQWHWTVLATGSRRTSGCQIISGVITKIHMGIWVASASAKRSWPLI